MHFVPRIIDPLGLVGKVEDAATDGQYRIIDTVGSPGERRN